MTVNLNDEKHAAPQYSRSTGSDGRELNLPGEAFGRFGVRRFRPKVMDGPHWHGHVEFNLIEGADMVYDYDGDELVIPEGRVVMFWAGVPHFITGFRSRAARQLSLTNLYVPLDQFLMMPSINALQVAVLSGEIIALPPSALKKDSLFQWLEDDRLGSADVREIAKGELTLALRRAQLGELESLDSGARSSRRTRGLNQSQIATLVEMLRFILENVQHPLRTRDVAETVGLHPNYASSLFTRALGVPMKSFMIRVRLLRCRAQLIEGVTAISRVAEDSGFSSLTQFYDHFKAAYGMTPSAMRRRYGSGG